MLASAAGIAAVASPASALSSPVSSGAPSRPPTSARRRSRLSSLTSEESPSTFSPIAPRRRPDLIGTDVQLFGNLVYTGHRRDRLDGAEVCGRPHEDEGLAHDGALGDRPEAS